MQTRRLYDIADDFKRFDEALEAGEIPEEAICDTLEGLAMEADAKIGSICDLIKHYTSFAEDIRAEVKALQERQKACEKRAERLKEYIRLCLDKMGRDGFQNARHRVSFRTSEAVVVRDAEQLTNWLKDNAPEVIKVKEEISLTALGQLIKGGEVPFAEIVKKKNVQIK